MLLLRRFARPLACFTPKPGCRGNSDEVQEKNNTHLFRIDSAFARRATHERDELAPFATIAFDDLARYAAYDGRIDVVRVRDFSTKFAQRRRAQRALARRAAFESVDRRRGGGARGGRRDASRSSRSSRSCSRRRGRRRSR